MSKIKYFKPKDNLNNIWNFIYNLAEYTMYLLYKTKRLMLFRK